MTTFAVYIHLEESARAAVSAAELRLKMVNEPRQFAPYRLAALFDMSGTAPALAALSDIPTAAPLPQSLITAFRRTQLPPTTTSYVVATVSDLPPAILALPLRRRDTGALMAVLWLCRDEHWSEHDRIMLDRLTGCYAQALAALTEPPAA